MLATLQDEEKRVALLVEMAIMVDAGKIFVQTTHNLEGDGTLVLDCFEKLEAVNRSIQVKHFPNTNAIIALVTKSKPPHVAQQWQQYAQNCVQPGFDYYQNRFNGHFGLTVSAFKAARLFNPSKLDYLCPDATSVNSLATFSLLQHDELLSGLKEELPMYLALGSRCQSSRVVEAS